MPREEALYLAAKSGEPVQHVRDRETRLRVRARQDECVRLLKARDRWECGL